MNKEYIQRELDNINAHLVNIQIHKFQPYRPMEETYEDLLIERDLFVNVYIEKGEYLVKHKNTINSYLMNGYTLKEANRFTKIEDMLDKG